jgi:hypothetical protein
LAQGGSLHPWKSPSVIATIAVGGLAVIAFLVWEAKADLKEPLIPLYLFRNLQWFAIVMVLSISVTVYYAFTIIWPQMVFGLYETDLLRGGLLCCLVGAGTNAGQLSSSLGRQLGNQRYQFIAGTIVGGALLGAVACVTPNNLATTATLITLGSMALGFTDSVGLAMAGIAIENQQDIGSAVGVAGSIRNTISTIGVAIYSVRTTWRDSSAVINISQVILTNRLGETIPKEVPPALIKAGLPSSSVAAFLSAYIIGTETAFSAVEGLTPQILATGTSAYKKASADAYRTVFLSTIAFSCVAIICAFFTANGQKMMTNDVAATLHQRATKRVVGEKELV